MVKIRRALAGQSVESPPRPSRRRGRAGAIAVMLVSSALTLAACGGSSSSSSTDSSAPARSGGTPASAQTANSNQLAQFSHCMRAHGIPSFPDPVNGHLNLTVTKGGPLDPRSPAFQSAERECKSLAPAGLNGSAPSPQTQSAQLKFVNCMHSRGVPNFPDPQPNGGFLVQGGGIDPNSPTFQSAIQSCRKLLPGGGTTLGG